MKHGIERLGLKRTYLCMESWLASDHFLSVSGEVCLLVVTRGTEELCNQDCSGCGPDVL